MFYTDASGTGKCSLPLLPFTVIAISKYTSRSEQACREWQLWSTPGNSDPDVSLIVALAVHCGFI